jgi:hypothetical protein
MSTESYVMREQARDTVHRIMRPEAQRQLAPRPAWLGLVLLVAALNMIAMIGPA